MLDSSDLHVQARDGYIHVSTVHPAWLEKPWNIIAALFEEGRDVWAAGGHENVIDEIEYEEKWIAESRVRRRMGLYRNIAIDAYGPLSALGNRDGTERTQVSMNGVRPHHRRPVNNTHARKSISFFLNGGR